MKIKFLLTSLIAIMALAQNAQAKYICNSFSREELNDQVGQILYVSLQPLQKGDYGNFITLNKMILDAYDATKNCLDNTHKQEIKKILTLSSDPALLENLIKDKKIKHNLQKLRPRINKTLKELN